MIRHVVSWKLKDEDAEAREIAATEIAAALTSLPALIPEILSLTVGRNVAYPDSNWDVVLIADFDSLEALDAYQVHPEHQKVIPVIRERVSARAAVGFEV
ncbi:MAG: Dabb family protein [Microbacteriaceae bacterium]